MAVFGMALRAHNPFLGYHGDFDEAATACFKTAIIFTVLSVVSIISFVISALRSKMQPTAHQLTNGDYQAV